MPMSGDHEMDLRFGDFTIVRADERLIGPAGPVKLGRKAFRVLLMLAERDGQLLTKDALFASVWDGTIVSESALTSVIKELRRALDDPSVNPRFIESVYGRGYRLRAPVGQVAPMLTDRPVEAAVKRMGEAPLLFVPTFDDVAIVATHPHFGAVIHEEMLIALSRFRDIRLVPDLPALRDGAGRFGERDYRLDVRLIGDEAGIHAFARMSRLSSGAIIWADQIPVPAGNPLQGIASLAHRVAGLALPRLRDDVLRNLPAQPGGAYDHYFLNRLRMRDLDDLGSARAVARSWEQLIGEHPDLAQAYPPLIRLYNTDFSFTGPGATGPDERRRAYELAHRAIIIDPTDSHLHTVKGWCHLWAGEAGLAERHFEEALQLNPYHHERLVEIATGFMFLDDLGRAAELLGRCRALTAFASDAPQEEEGLLRLLREDYRGAADALALARRVHPDDRIQARPGLLTGLYALLAAAGADDERLDEQAAQWRGVVATRWAGESPADQATLKRWIGFHNPFQRDERRRWLDALIERALAPHPQAAPRTTTPAPRGKPSARG